MKNSAIDYLIEYVNSENENKWLQSVVSCYICSNEEISDLNIEILKENLLTNKNKKYLLSTESDISENLNSIKLKRIHHKSGVNALANNQEIIFNEQVTILYGLNGSGKSSYFRILQAMIGNIKTSEIIPNIYLENYQEPSVDLDYSINSINKNVSWNNQDKIENLKTIKVFDSKYSLKFLEKRESDEQVLYPYKLYVFSEISQYIDKIKNLANISLDQRMKNNIPPNIENFNEKEKKIFENDMTEKDLEYFSDISENFSETKVQELADIQNKIKLLIETNYSVKLELLENKKRNYEDFKKYVKSTLLPWLNKSKEYHQQVILYEKYKKELEEKKKQIQVLSNLPGTETDEWRSFIKMGLSISDDLKDNREFCPYCYREYDDKALSIVEAYSIFIGDITSEKLSTCESNINNIIDESIHVNLEYKEYLFEEQRELEENIKLLVKKISEYFKKIEKLEYVIENIEPIIFDTSFINSKFKEIDKFYKVKVESCIKESSEKEEKLKKLIQRKSELSSQNSIYEQFDIISKYIEENISINKLRKTISDITSYKISSISIKAHKELLSSQLVNKFKYFLEKFEIMDRGIKLKTSNSKGTQQTELIMNTKNHVTKILSEGEQKAVSIALFLAEISVAKNKSTIILDDPVNSLDHRMMDCLSNVLLQFDNQIVIFTHNRMFLDSMYGSKYGHFCKNFKKNGCNKKKGKHIFAYKINSEGPNEKGVITSKRNYDAKGYLSDAKELLNKSPFDEELKVCALLRNAIDHIIDEIIFNEQIPRKYSMKGVNQSIQWEKLKEMGSNSKIIDDLKKTYGRVSSSELHLGQVNYGNPADKEELLRLYEKLEKILTKSS